MKRDAAPEKAKPTRNCDHRRRGRSNQGYLSVEGVICRADQRTRPETKLMGGHNSSDRTPPPQSQYVGRLVNDDEMVHYGGRGALADLQSGGAYLVRLSPDAFVRLEGRR